jgi:hypothetical protein
VHGAPLRASAPYIAQIARPICAAASAGLQDGARVLGPSRRARLRVGVPADARLGSGARTAHLSTQSTPPGEPLPDSLTLSASDGAAHLSTKSTPPGVRHPASQAKRLLQHGLARAFNPPQPVAHERRCAHALARVRRSSAAHGRRCASRLSNAPHVRAQAVGEDGTGTPWVPCEYPLS